MDVLDIIKQYENLVKMGFTIYETGTEYPPLDVDLFVFMWKNHIRVDMIRNTETRYVVYNGVNIG